MTDSVGWGRYEENGRSRYLLNIVFQGLYFHVAALPGRHVPSGSWVVEMELGTLALLTLRHHLQSRYRISANDSGRT